MCEVGWVQVFGLDGFRVDETRKCYFVKWSSQPRAKTTTDLFPGKLAGQLLVKTT